MTALALSQALGVQNAFACAVGEDARGEHTQMAMEHDMTSNEAPSENGCDTTPHPSCPSTPGDGSCALMSACATPAALVERAVPALSVAQRAPAPVTFQHELRRSTAPEPPPPRA